MSELDDFYAHRNRLNKHIQKSFSSEERYLTVAPEIDLIEKARKRLEGDLFWKDGKCYMWVQYAPGKYDWHKINNNTPVKIGTGYKGTHGVAGVKKAFESVDKSYTDVDKMTLQRTPNGFWRLQYNNEDTGLTIDGECFTMHELRKENVCYKANMIVDNFDMMKDYLQFNSPDDVYFVQIIKRYKDNKDKPDAEQWRRDGKQKGTYHAGAEYMEHWLIHSVDELDNLRQQIVKDCSYNNARAYVSINPRSESQTQAYIPKFQQRVLSQTKNPNDPRIQHAEAILYGMAKTGDAWKNERFRVLLDIDTVRDSTAMVGGKKVNVWDETKRRLQQYGIKVAAEYQTPSGGLHLIINNKNNRNLKPFYAGLKDFDGGRDLGYQATVHPSEDIKMVLYSDVDTAGY